MSKRRALGALALALPLTIALALNAPAGHAEPLLQDGYYENAIALLIGYSQNLIWGYGMSNANGYFIHPAYPDTLLQISPKQGTIFYRADAPLEGNAYRFLVTNADGKKHLLDG